MFDRAWDALVSALITLTLPFICFYHAICGNIFLNVSVKQASGLEKAGNFLLTPFQYLFAGKEANLKEDGSWEITQKYDYNHFLAQKAIASISMLPTSLLMGCTVKGLSLLFPETQKNYQSLIAQTKATNIHSNENQYKQWGLHVNEAFPSWFLSQKHQRRPGDENHMKKAKEGLKEIGCILNESNIPWWVDCGTLLGTYRYGGIIPWDDDLDIALLLPDFENARRAFNRLDPEKYMVQDWSGRDFPQTFFKILIRETGDFIDIYFYEVKPEEKICRYIFALDKTIFFFDWWKQRERRFEKPIGFDQLFPLKKALFDGVEVFVPNDPVSFLQRYYGENLAPVKIYDPNTNRFEKDLTHPYWAIPYVH